MPRLKRPNYRQPRCSPEAGLGKTCKHERVTKSPGEDAAERARSAHQRALELEERRRRLLNGQPATAEDVRQAEQAAVVEQRRSVNAHRRAAQAHMRAAEGHRQASQLLDAVGHPEEAAEHRRRAEADDDAALVDDDAAHVDQQS
jgi:hypothetical protein